MPPWRRPRYWCANVAGRCPHALADLAFNTAQFEAWQGLCGGPAAEKGCGQPLKVGEPLNLGTRWLARGAGIGASVAVLTWALRTLVFPPPLEHLAFATPQTKIDESQTSLQVEVVRDATLDRRIEVQCRTLDASAKAGIDYQASSGRLVFEAGERRKALSIALLPGPGEPRGERHFAVVLGNVAGEPRHLVVIEPKPVDRSARLQAEQAVMLASRIAADIAGFAVKREVLDGLMASSREDPAGFKTYRQQLAEVDSNLTRAREGYAQALRDLRTHAPVLVLQSMDKLEHDLADRAFAQQSKAMGVMKRQFGELLQRDAMDMDRWVQELSRTVPRVPPGGAPRPSA